MVAAMQKELDGDLGQSLDLSGAMGSDTRGFPNPSGGHGAFLLSHCLRFPLPHPALCPMALVACGQGGWGASGPPPEHGRRRVR